MQLVNYNPTTDFKKMEKELDRFWENGWGILPAFTDMSTMDMYEEDGKLIAEVSLPNFKKDEIKVTKQQGVLEISAEHTEKKEDKSKRRYYFRESNDKYLRRVALPEGVKDDKPEAEFKNGILKITMPAVTVVKTEVSTVPIK